jgi:transcription antitermination factor NusG
MQTLECEALNTIGAEQAPWYAVHTRYQHEQRVHQQLERKGFPIFYPTCTTWRNWNDRRKKLSQALFPGYLFIGEIENRLLQVLATPGVCGIVSIAGVPAPIPLSEIEAIQRAISSPYAVEAHPYLETGDPVRILDGPLNGVTGILVRTDKSTRLVLSIELLGRSVGVEIDAESVTRAVPQR